MTGLTRAPCLQPGILRHWIPDPARDIAIGKRLGGAAELVLPLKRLSNGQIERMAEAIRDTLKSGPTAFRKAYLKLLIDRIEVSPSEIRITGSKAALAAAMQARDCSPNEVRFFDREWRTREDSNLWPPPSEGGALSS